MSAAELHQILLSLVVLIIGFSIHEWAHAFTADKLGDPTPRSLGRVTLNPIAHMTLIGTVILPLILIFVTGGKFFFAAGKPVPIDLSYFPPQKRARYDVLVTLAGPGSNLALALLSAIIGGIACRFVPSLADLVDLFIQINVLLAIFNLIPIPPLDGSRVFRYISGMTEETFYRLSQWGIFILLIALQIPPVRQVFVFIMAAVYLPFALLFNFIVGL